MCSPPPSPVSPFKAPISYLVPPRVSPIFLSSLGVPNIFQLYWTDGYRKNTTRLLRPSRAPLGLPSVGSLRPPPSPASADPSASFECESENMELLLGMQILSDPILGRSRASKERKAERKGKHGNAEEGTSCEGPFSLSRSLLSNVPVLFGAPG